MGERTAEEWGRVAVALPGWRWMPGMVFGSLYAHGMNARVQAHDITTDTDAPDVYWFLPESPPSDAWPDPDDPATAGCLLALLGPEAAHMTTAVFIRHNAVEIDLLVGPTVVHRSSGPHRNLGRTCIATAEAIGRWPGGAA